MGLEWSVMVVVLVALVILALLAGVAVLARRSGGDEIDSVRSYHAAVGTMERLPTRSVTTAVAPRRPYDIDDADRGADGGIGGPVPWTGDATGARDPAAAGAGAGSASGLRPPALRPARLMFDDASPLDPSATLAGSGAPIRRDRRMRNSALDSMNRRSRPVNAVLIVVVLVVSVGALAYIGSRHSGHRPPASSTATSNPAHPGHPAAKTAGGTGHRSASSRDTVHHAPPPAKPTQLAAVSSTAQTATYSVGSVPFSVTVHASQTCWVQATSEPAGTVVWQGLLQPGGSQVIKATGVTVVELGAAGASMTVNSVPVLIPTASVTPFTATFQPSTT
jgi:hypothetical protein